MPSKSDNRPCRPSLPSLIRAAVSPLALSVLMAMLVSAASVALAADGKNGKPLHLFQLQPGTTGTVGSDGGLVIERTGSRDPLLQGVVLPRRDARRQRQGDLFHATVSEGVPGGHRGFSARADDDGDGRIDEDLLDGLDNDGDGYVDEDFAAVSDAMVAVRLKGRRGANRVTHLEYYHWEHSHLSSAVFLNLGGGTTTDTGQSYRLGSGGAPWQETATVPLVHTVSGDLRQEDLTAFVCRIDLAGNALVDPCSPGAYRWLGVMILDENPAGRFRRDADLLEIPLSDQPVPVVVCVADSWLQLNRILGEAQSVYEGVTDPVDSRTTPWIVPAICSTCRAAAAPTFTLVAGDDATFALTTDMAAGQCGLLDPDLFSIDDRPLGAPREIRWRPAGGGNLDLPWNCLTPEYLKEHGPIAPTALMAELMNHEATGRLTFVFDAPQVMPGPGELEGRYFDGRPLVTGLAGQSRSVEAPTSPETLLSPDPSAEDVEDTSRRYAEDRARLLEQERGRLGLSPELLVGWPNPFRDQINIRFTVPQTMAEAFVWTDKANQPTGVELEGDVPWSGGRPTVSVKIYNVNGQELVTLHSASEGTGEYSVHWNGTDAYGRKVASGPYFCKLQMDDWSVTRQIVFLR